MSGYSDREYVYSRRGSSRPRTIDEDVVVQRRRSSAVAPKEVSVEYSHREYDRGRSVSSSRRSSSYVEQGEYFDQGSSLTALSSRLTRAKGPLMPYEYERRSSASSEPLSPRSKPSSRRASSTTSVTRRTSAQSNGPLTVACGPVCADNPNRRTSSVSSTSTNKSLLKPNDEPFTATEERVDEKKRRNKQLLYTGLAGITTVAAANNIYQSSKAHRTRQQAVRDGVMCRSEARHERNKALALDLAAVGIGAIAVNNAVNGWKKTNSLRREDAEARELWAQRREVRHEVKSMRKAIESY